MTAAEAGVVGAAYALLQALGVLAAGRAVMQARTAQGAAAWAVALIAFRCWPCRCSWCSARTGSPTMWPRGGPRSPNSGRRSSACRRLWRAATRYTRDVPFERLAKLPFACRAPMSAHCAPAAWKCMPFTRSVAGPAGCTLPFESAQVPSSTRCTNATAIAPSPTAAAQRRTALWRTSPAANTPGMLVSR